MSRSLCTYLIFWSLQPSREEHEEQVGEASERLRRYGLLLKERRVICTQYWCCPSVADYRPMAYVPGHKNIQGSGGAPGN